MLLLQGFLPNFNDAFINNAKQKDIDVVNMINQMSNKTVIDNLNFYEGTGKIYYYLFNYNTNEINIENLGLVII